MTCWVFFYLFIETTFHVPTLIGRGQEMGMEDRNTDVGPSLILEGKVICGGFLFSLMDKAWYLGENALIF